MPCSCFGLKRPNRSIFARWSWSPFRSAASRSIPSSLCWRWRGFAVLALLALAIALIVHMSRRRRESEAQASELAELKGRLQSFAEISVARQGDIARAVNERLDRMTHRVGTDLNETSRKTHELIAKLNERLAVIDTAQKNLTDLSTNMVELAGDPRQQAGARRVRPDAHGDHRQGRPAQGRLHLPGDALERQAARLPAAYAEHAAASVVIDAKFPLEGFEAFRIARRDEEKKEAARRVRVDVGRHVDAMAERYFIAGETQDTAILFVPSEAIYADLCEHFSDLVQKAHRARIVICAPNMLMLAVQTMQAILKDVQMREQAHLIQREVAKLMDDMGRFRERVLDLQRHFGQANEDIEKILTSSEKIAAARAQDRDLGVRGGSARGKIEQRNGASPSAPALSPKGRGRGAAARGEAAERRVPPARSARQRRHDHAATALAGHRARPNAGRRGGEPRQPHHPRGAARDGGVDRARLAARDSFVPAFVQYTIVIVLTGTLLMAGHFVEVMVWAVTYALVGVAPARHRAHLSRFRQLHDAWLCRPGRAGTMAAAPADDGAERHHADRLVDGADHRDLAPVSGHAAPAQNADWSPGNCPLLAER